MGEEVKNKKRKKKKKSSRLKKVLLIVPLIIIILFFASFLYLSRLSSNSVNIDLGGNKNSNIVNFLVMGVDIGEDESYPKRTDTIMLVHYDKKQHTYDVISIPRDTMVYFDGELGKINAAHALGGVQQSVDKVEELLNINIDYYLKVDTKAFREFIDALGGVDVLITQNMQYEDESQDLKIDFKASNKMQHLDGKKAEEFIRWRKNNDGTGFADGDIGRIKQQQSFYSNVLQKLKSPSMIFKAPKILSIFPKYMETNLDATDIMKYGISVVTASKENIRFHTLQGEAAYVDGTSYYNYEPEMNEEILSILKNSEPNETSESNTSNSGSGLSMSKESIRVNVLNGTNKEGLAGEFANKVMKLGYNNCDFGNYDANLKPVKVSQIKLYGLTSDDAKILKKEFGIKNVEVMNEVNPNYEMEIILGDDKAKD